MRTSIGIIAGSLSLFVLSLGGLGLGLSACSDDPAPAAPDGGSGNAEGGSSSPDGGGASDPDTGASSALGKGPYTIAYAGTEVGIDMRSIADGKAKHESGKLVSYEASEDERPEVGTNQVSETGGDAFIQVGRWSGGTTAGKFYEIAGTGLLPLPANGGFHYVIGTSVETLPSSGNQTYTILAKTSATVSDGSAAPGAVSGSLAAQLAGAASKIGFSITLEVPGDATYTLATTGGTADLSASEAELSGGNLKGAFYTNLTLTTTGAACASGAGSCSGSVYAFVSGPNAERIGLVAHVYKGSGGSPKSVAGAIAFKK